MSLTAHCLVKNEEVFVTHAVTSVIDFVEQVFVYDTGSTDTTVKLIKELVKKYPNKIVFEEKGPCDKKRHTELRQEMVAKTKTDWFMVLDGDEVWSSQAMQEATGIIASQPQVECIMTPFYLCVGDVRHRYYKSGQIEMLGKKDFFYPRFIKLVNGVHWSGDYNEDTIINQKGEVFFNLKNSAIMTAHYWHMTHLKRSSADDDDYSSGGTRLSKRKLTYLFIGRKINEPIPEVLQSKEFFLTPQKSFINFWKLLCSRL